MKDCTLAEVRGDGAMRYGYWMPVFGGWLRNVDDEQMDATWAYVRDLAMKSEQWGYDLSLIAELHMNDIKGITAPALDAWSTAAALAAVTSTLELMVAVRPNFHQPAPFARMAANVDHIAGGRLSLNVVSSWWADEARRFGLPFDRHDDRYARTSEWLTVVNGMWREETFDFRGRFYTTEQAICAPKPARPPVIYAGGESDAAKALIAGRCDAYVMHGDPVEVVAPKIADMASRRAATGKAPLRYGMAAYAIVRDSEAEAARELARITSVSGLPAGYANFNEWLSGTELEREMKIQEYAVSNRGLRPNLVGTPEQLRERIEAYEAAGLDLLLLQMSPQAEEMERFAAQVMRR